MDPINSHGACTKVYTDKQIAHSKTTLQTETKHLFSTCVQGKMLTIRFDLTRLQASTVHKLGDRSEQNFFIISHRFKTRDNLWNARDNPKVEIAVKDYFYIFKGEHYFLHEL